ncbi:hypothetical protein, partial [Alkalihalobacterium elongatum]|uniref:hypothetical protein n=1 Tax=Alkalihalobacterium elongatum TaxID=2675466 RepID=UPI001C1F61CB
KVFDIAHCHKRDVFKTLTRYHVSLYIAWLFVQFSKNFFTAVSAATKFIIAHLIILRNNFF